MLRKKCGGCQSEKEIANFYKNKRKKDGYQNYCKPCTKVSNATSFQAHKKERMAKSSERQRSEKGIAYRSEYYSKRKREVAKQDVAPDVYQRQHVEHRAQAATHDERNKAAILAQQRESPQYKNRFAKYGALHKDKKNDGTRKWRENNRIRTRDYNAWYRETVSNTTKQTWKERNVQLGYGNASLGRPSLHRKQHDEKDGLIGKSCSACKTWSSLDNFNLNSKAWDKKRTTCKDCMTAKRKKRCSQRSAYMLVYEKKRKREDPEFALRKRLRSRINSALKGVRAVKLDTSMNLVGCDIKTAKKYIEDQFEDWMSWSNTKEWHIDHIVPFNAFKGDLNHINQHIVCWYQNFKPVSAKDNLSKGGAYDEEDKQDLIRRYNEAHLS